MAVSNLAHEAGRCGEPGEHGTEVGVEREHAGDDRGERQPDQVDAWQQQLETGQY